MKTYKLPLELIWDVSKNKEREVHSTSFFSYQFEIILEKGKIILTKTNK